MSCDVESAEVLKIVLGMRGCMITYLHLQDFVIDIVQGLLDSISVL